MRVGVAYCRGLSFEGLCVGRTRLDLAGRRHRPPGGSPLHHHAGPRVTAAVPCDIAVGAYRDPRRRLLVFRRTGTALPMALDGDGGRHDRKGGFLSIGRPYWRGPVIAWCVSREDVDYRFWGLGLCALAVLLLYELGWVGRSESRGIVGDMQNGSGCCAVPLGSP
jgi:hypothetical protein